MAVQLVMRQVAAGSTWAPRLGMVLPVDLVVLRVRICLLRLRRQLVPEQLLRLRQRRQRLPWLERPVMRQGPAYCPRLLL